MPRPAGLLALCIGLTLSSRCALAQGPMTPPRSPVDAPRTYENSPDGLRWQLQDLRNAARENNPAQLETLIRLTEISQPNWFNRAFGEEKGAFWSQAYTENLTESEKNFADLMRRLAGEDGEFLVRNIKYEPAPARPIESTLVESLRLPVNIFFANWKIQNSAPDTKSTPVGYFVFIDDRFRWDSAIIPVDPHFVVGADRDGAQPKDVPGKSSDSSGLTDNSKPPYKPGMGGVTYPQCFYTPDPKYSKVARKKRLEGTVLLQGVVQPEGNITNVKVLKSPDSELTDSAIEAVSTWRCKPARTYDGEPVAVLVSVELNFRLLQ